MSNIAEACHVYAHLYIVYMSLLSNMSSNHMLLIDSFGVYVCIAGKYREFHHKYQDGDLKGASTLLLNLLTARAAPRQYE